MQIDNKNNNFGFLRLFLAILVIVSHSPEAIDGNRNRELLTNIFGTLSFGEFAVNGFFLISGYLIHKSYENSSSLKSYFYKRVLRIYPAFIVAHIFFMLCIVPLLLNFHSLFNLEIKYWLKSVVRMLILDSPYPVDGVFDKNPYKATNISMWTIRYEFLCYLAIPLLSYLPVNKIKVLSVVITLYVISGIFDINFSTPYPIIIELKQVLRLFSAFLIGEIFYIYREKIIYNKALTFVSIFGLIALLFNDRFAEIGLMTFGAYLLFNFALNYKSKYLNKVGSKVDLSYGIYLYAWPIQNLFIQYQSNLNPYMLMIYTLVISSMIACLSWFYVEKPFIQLKGKLDFNVRNAAIKL